MNLSPEGRKNEDNERLDYEKLVKRILRVLQLLAIIIIIVLLFRACSNLGKSNISPSQKTSGSKYTSIPRNRIKNVLESKGYNVTDIEMTDLDYIVVKINLDPPVYENRARNIAIRSVQIIYDELKAQGIKMSIRVTLVGPSESPNFVTHYGSARLSKYGGSIEWKPNYK